MKIDSLIRNRVSAIVINEDKILTFRAKDPSSGKEYFFLPGGLIEPHETFLEAAVRETREETGYSVKAFQESSQTLEYIFRWNGDNVRCNTVFVIATLCSMNCELVKDAHYNLGVQWVPVQDIDSVFNYHAQILNAVQGVVGHHLGSMDGVHYFMNRKLLLEDIIEVFDSSGIIRPISDQKRIIKMFENSNLIISAFHENQLVGVARALSDFSYSTYLSDLAISKPFQKKGIGTMLVSKIREVTGDTSNLVLLSANGAMDYYPRIGFKNINNAFLITRKV